MCLKCIRSINVEAFIAVAVSIVLISIGIRYKSNIPSCETIKGLFLQPHIRVWRSDTLQTTHVLDQFEKAVMCLSFSKSQVCM